MGTPKILAVVLIIAGVLAMVYQGFTYRSNDRVVDLGPVHVNAERSHSVPVPPVIGAIALIGGIALLFTGRNR